MRISVVLSGLSEANERLQPWRYVSELAAGLVRLGHAVELISEAGSSLPGDPGKPTRLGLQSLGRSGGLAEHLRATRPDLVMWNTGATSALHLRPLRLFETCHVAIFTSPLYRPLDLQRAGTDLCRHPATYAAVGLGSLLPRRYIAAYLNAEFAHVIAPGATTMRRLVASGLKPIRISALPPGRDVDIQSGAAPPRTATGAMTFVYVGSPLPIRGPDVLLRAFALGYPIIENARLLMLIRHERAGLAEHTDRLVRLAAHLGVDRRVEILSGTLPRTKFLEQLGRADAFVLPFRLVPSEAPLAVLEAAGAGRPLIASDLAAVADLAAPGSLLVRPGDVSDLSRALKRLAAEPARMQQLGMDARRWYASWPTWPEVVERLHTILISLARTSAGGPRRTPSPAGGQGLTRTE